MNDMPNGIPILSVKRGIFLSKVAANIPCSAEM